MGRGNLRILQLNKLYHPETGGVEHVVQQLAEGLNGRTDMKVLVCSRKGRTLEENVNGVHVRRASSLGVLFSMPVSFSFFHHFNQLKKDRDILHIHMPFPLADVAVALFGFSGKVAVWWHSDIVRQKFFLALYKPFMRRLLKRADVIITATRGHIDNSDFLPEFAGKCAVIPFGVKTDGEFAPARRNGDVTVLFVGRLVYYKGCEVLLEAFRQVSGARLRMVGGGVLEEKLKKISEGLSGRVEFLGNISDQELAKEFENCDIFVLPSIAKSEAFGLVQIEAMSRGKPVINTNLPSGVPYVSLDGVTGLTVPPSDAGALAAAMQKLIDDEPLRMAYGRAAYRRVREEFLESVMLDRVMAVYEKLLEA